MKNLTQIETFKIDGDYFTRTKGMFPKNEVLDDLDVTWFKGINTNARMIPRDQLDKEAAFELEAKYSEFMQEQFE